MSKTEQQLSTSDLAARTKTTSDDVTQQDGTDRGTDGTVKVDDARRQVRTDVSDGKQATESGSDAREDDESRASLVEPAEAAELQAKWTAIQVDFVDQPRDAVSKADELVAQCMQQLASRFADERKRLEEQWSSGDDIDTEDLRVALRRYRSFFQRLLSA